MTTGSAHQSDSFGAESGLLAAATQVLIAEGFTMAVAALPDGRQMVLAEDDFFVLGIVEFASAQDLLTAESAASELLTNRVSEGRSSPKSWDAYLMLLTTARELFDGSSDVVTLVVYNTRSLRRMVRHALVPDSASLREALQPFLPLTAAGSTHVAAPLDLLQGEAANRGVSSEVFLELMQKFKRDRSYEP